MCILGYVLQTFEIVLRGGLIRGCKHHIKLKQNNYHSIVFMVYFSAADFQFGISNVTSLMCSYHFQRVPKNVHCQFRMSSAGT